MRGYTVAHIKTDSIKIPNADMEIINFVMDFGKKYGYTFEHEATYEKMCLVNDAVYIAKYRDVEWCENKYGYIPSKQAKNAGKWTATGTQFAVPYVFKTLFSKEPIEFEDMCETKSVTTSLHLDMNESLPNVSTYETALSIRQSPKGLDDLTKKEKSVLELFDGIPDEELVQTIATGHNYHFVGRVGQFCPIKPGCGGGELLREGKDREGNTKYFSATGAKGYRWLESEMVRELGKEADIDKSYYIKLVDDAKDAISQYGDFEWFVSDDPTPELEAPPWNVACGKETCEGCPHFLYEQSGMRCERGYDIGDMIRLNTTQEWEDENDDFKKR
jgi:hypothetical protein